METHTGAVEVLGIDAGGTMTDTLVVGKAQSNPDDESVALLNLAEDALGLWGTTVEQEFPDMVTAVYSGTTRLNRVVSRKGLDVGLIVNRGMENVPRIGRAIQSYLGYAYEDRLQLNTPATTNRWSHAATPAA